MITIASKSLKQASKTLLAVQPSSSLFAPLVRHKFTFKEKEQAEEADYIKKMETKQREEAKLKLQKEQNQKKAATAAEKSEGKNQRKKQQ